jgi:spore maturation protein CgeB
MRLVIFGLTVSSSWGNGHATIWRGLCGALARQGHQVTFFEKDVPYYASQRDLHSPDTFNLVLYPDWGQVRSKAESALRNSDVAIVTSYCPDARPAADLLLNFDNCLHVFYDLDTPVTLERLRGGEDVAYLPSYGLEPFDLVLSYTGGRALDELKGLLGARRVAPLYGSVDPQLHKPAESSSQYQADLSYIGTYAQDRQAALQELFIEPARKAPGKRFVIAGAQYPPDFPWCENIWFVRHLPPPEHPTFYASSKLTLSVTRAAMAEMGYCPSGRLFEAAACGTPIVSDGWQGIDEFFEPGEEIVVASAASEVSSALEDNSGALQRMAAAARERVLDEHTADHRSLELIDLLEAAA